MLNALRVEPSTAFPAAGGKEGEENSSGPSILPLRVENLSLMRNGRFLLDDLSFTLEAGAISVVLGPNGAGKTLLLKICHGLLVPSRGKVSWGLTDPTRIRQNQAMVFQRTVLLKRSVAANIDYALKLNGLGKAERLERIDQCLQLSGLQALHRRPARVLSGGEQQRLALARAWAVRPQVLFLDEPTANIDPPATAAIENLVRNFANQGVKIVMTTHDLYQAKRLAGEVLFLHEGRLLEKTPAEKFFEHPETSAAESFIRGELLCP
ncbi:MAG: ATP-binding cassette domain-containing protein [Gammaproteobacteria bacterium]